MLHRQVSGGLFLGCILTVRLAMPHPFSHCDVTEFTFSSCFGCLVVSLLKSFNCEFLSTLDSALRICLPPVFIVGVFYVSIKPEQGQRLKQTISKLFHKAKITPRPRKHKTRASRGVHYFYWSGRAGLFRAIFCLPNQYLLKHYQYIS